MIRLAETLVAFLWQGALVACLLAAGNLVLRKASARYAAACAALLALFLFPAATFWRLASIPVDPAAATAPDSGVTVSSLSPSAKALRTAPALPLPRLSAGAERSIVLVWLAGVLVLSVRLAGSWAAAEQLRWRGVADPEAPWAERATRIARRLGLTRPVRLLASTRVSVPTAFGVLSPVVLLPVAAFTALPVRELEALLAHELAHIRRHDYLVNLAQSVAETLFFYHPAVWWVSHRLRIERENACDDMAVLAVGSVTIYARALLDLEESRVQAPLLTVAASGGTLSSRVSRLLLRSRSGERGPRVLPAVLATAAVAAVFVAARPESARAVPVPPPAAAAAPAAPSAPLASRPSASPAPAVPAATRRQPARPARAAAPSPGAPPAEAAATPDAAASPEAAEPGRGAEASPAKSAGRLLTPEQLIAFRIHGVTPEFIEEIRALGFSRVTVDELTAMRIHGVTPEFARAMRAEGFEPTIAQLIEFRIHGLTPEFLREVRSLGLPRLSPSEGVAFRIHGVTPSFIREVRDLGYPNLSAQDFVSMRIHGVTPDYIRKMNRLYREKLSVDDLVGARIHGIRGDDR